MILRNIHPASIKVRCFAEIKGKTYVVALKRRGDKIEKN